jgi:mono/diheme cytochrome c family protein
MNRDHDVFAIGIAANQIDVLAQVGYFASPPEEPAVNYDRFPQPGDVEASDESWSRAYLQANCAQCHLDGGPTGIPIDLRYDLALADTGTCDVAPSDDLGVTDARIIDPGSAEGSVLWLRVDRVGEAQMPPLARNLIDDTAVARLQAWIDALEGCE